MMILHAPSVRVLGGGGDARVQINDFVDGSCTQAFAFPSLSLTARVNADRTRALSLSA